MQEADARSAGSGIDVVANGVGIFIFPTHLSLPSSDSGVLVGAWLALVVLTLFGIPSRVWVGHQGWFGRGLNRGIHGFSCAACANTVPRTHRVRM